MPRPDVSENLVHFTGGGSDLEAFENLRSIIRDRQIRGSYRLIRGHYTCACFTEAPLGALGGGFVNLQEFSRYRPFGIIFDKAYLYALGARPVIYSADNEFEELSEYCKWRYMRYEPDAIPPVDFTWEREWRIQAPQVDVQPHTSAIVLPTREWAERLVELHDDEQSYLVRMYAQIMDDDIAQQYREEFPWRFYYLA
jgi:hypothetical protein